MKNKVVIGLGFGDEGKGKTVDYLCSKFPNSLVVRFSGGHQVGHTVVFDGTRHVFSNFGSGSLRGISTYWSKFCTVEPIGLMCELKILKDKLVNPIIHIDARCPITTPYDVYHNQVSSKHSTVGVGFGDTINREEHYYSLTFRDLFYPEIFECKLQAIESFYGMVMDLSLFRGSCKDIINSSLNVRLVEDVQKLFVRRYDAVIFEGSQGLMLDQHYGFFPYVTRSNTGSKNALELTKGHDTEYYLVTRAYQTRHGAGFMTNTDKPHNISVNPLETNVTNKFQGDFRGALLDVSLLEYAISKDEHIRNSEKTLLITCLDHIQNEYRFTYQGKIVYCTNEFEFVSKVSSLLNIKKVLISRHEESKNIEEF